MHFFSTVFFLNYFFFPKKNLILRKINATLNYYKKNINPLGSKRSHMGQIFELHVYNISGSYMAHTKKILLKENLKNFFSE